MSVWGLQHAPSSLEHETRPGVPVPIRLRTPQRCVMAFCTTVEWNEDLADALAGLHDNDVPPEGLLVRIVGATDSGTHAIEIWRSGDDARRFAESTAPALAAAALPPPTRVAGFEAASVFIRPEQ